MKFEPLKEERHSSDDLEERRRSSGRLSFPSVIVVNNTNKNGTNSVCKEENTERLRRRQIRRGRENEIVIARGEIAETEREIARVWEFADREKGGKREGGNR